MQTRSALCLRRCYLQPLRGHRRPFDLVHGAIARCVSCTSRRGSGRNVSSAWICATALASASRRRRPPPTPAAIPGWRRLIYVTVTNCRRLPGRIILLLYRHFRRRLAAAQLSASSVIRVGLGGALHCSCDCWPPRRSRSGAPAVQIDRAMFHRCRCRAPCLPSSCRTKFRGLCFRPMRPGWSYLPRFPGSCCLLRSCLSPFRKVPRRAIFVTVTYSVVAEVFPSCALVLGTVPPIRGVGSQDARAQACGAEAGKGGT